MKLNKILLIIILSITFLFQPKTSFAQTSPATTKEPLIKQTIDFPHIGEVTLEGTVDLEKKAYNFSAKLTDKKHKLSLGPLTIDEGEIRVSNETGLSLTGRATLFGKSAKIGLKETQLAQEGEEAKFFISKAVIGISFIDKPTLQIIPWGDPIALTNIDLILKPGEEVSLSTQVSIFKLETELKIGVIEGKSSASFELKELPLSNLLPPGVNVSQFGDIILKQIKFEISNFLPSKKSTKSEGPTAKVSGKIDFTSLKIPQIGQSLANLSMSASINKKEGINLEAELQDIPIANIGTIQIGTIQEVKLAFEINPFAKEEKNKKLSLFIGGKLNIQIPEVGGFTLSVNSKIEKDKFKIEGKLDSDLQPFKNTGIAQIKDITIKEARVALEISKDIKTIHVFGKSNILQNDVEADVKFVYTDQGLGVVLKGKLSPKWKLSDLSPAFGIPPFNTLQITNAQITASSIEYKDEKSGITVKPGLGFTASLKITGELENLKNIISFGQGSQAIDDLVIFGSIGTNLEDIMLGAEIPGILRFPPSTPLDSAGLKLVISAKPLSIYLAASLSTRELRIPSTPSVPFIPEIYFPKLKFSAKIQIEENEANISGSMIGTWKNVFGIKGFDISDLALEWHLGYELLAAGIPFSGLGLTGKGSLEEVNVEVALSLATDVEDIIVQGEIEDITVRKLSRLVKLFAPQIKFEEQAIPPIEIQKAKFYLAPLGGQIGEFKFPQGFGIEGKVNILDKIGLINLTITQQGLIAQGAIPQFTIPAPGVGTIFRLTGKGLDKEAGNEDDGPALDIALTTQEQKAYLSGWLIIPPLGISSETNVDITPTNYEFNTTTTIANLFEANIEGSAAFDFLKQPKFKLKIDFKDNFKVFIDKNLTKAIEDVSHDVSGGIGYIEKEIKNNNQLIDYNNSEIEKTNEKLKIQQKLWNSKKWWNIKRVPIGVEITRLSEYINRLKTANITLEISRNAALKALDVAKGAATQLGPVAKFAQAAIGEIGKKITDLKKLLSIKEAHFEGDLQEISKGVLPLLQLKVMFLNRPYNIKIQFDVKNPAKSIQTFLDELMKEVSTK